MMHINLMPDYEGLSAKLDLITLLGKLGVFRRLEMSAMHSEEVSWGSDA